MITRFDGNDAAWDALVERCGSVFFSSAWQSLLSATLGARVFGLLDSGADDGVAVQVFDRGPFGLGYVGFPIGGSVRGGIVGQQRIDRILEIAGRARCDVLRVPASGFRGPEPRGGKADRLPETCIRDLGACDLHRNAKVRHDVRRAERFGVTIEESNAHAMASRIYGSYVTTVVGHGGITKYSEPYFAGLCVLAATNRRVRILVALVDGRYAGFLVLVLEGLDAYYLHGAVEREYRTRGVSDLLVYQAIRIAAEHGMKSFNLMSSPRGQQSLVKFKEKWGGVTREHTTHEFVVRRWRARALGIAEHCYRRLQPAIAMVRSAVAIDLHAESHRRG